MCKGQSYAGKEKVGGDGMAADGWHMVGGGVKAMDSPAFDADEWVAKSREEITALFDGFEILEPGVVDVCRWRGFERPTHLSILAGVGRLPAPPDETVDRTAAGTTGAT